MEKPMIGIGADVGTGKTGKRERAFSFLSYIEALRRAGAIPVLIPPQPENVEQLLTELDGIVLAGGNDCDPSLYGEERHPSCELMDERRQAADLALARAARARGIPTLGICLGSQVINVAAGGTLYQDLASQFPGALAHVSEPDDRGRHDVSIEPGTRLASILGETHLNVNSSHHQAVRNVGRGLDVAAKAPDGVIEAVEDPSHRFFVGVQWHPEDMSTEGSATKLFRAFVEAARRYAAEREARVESREEVTFEANRAE